jgi:hypothetical protein
VRTRFQIRGAASSELLLRTLNLFAQHDLAPETLTAFREGDSYCIDIEIAGGTPARIELVVEKLRALVLVTEAVQIALPGERAAA